MRSSEQRQSAPGDQIQDTLSSTMAGVINQTHMFLIVGETGEEESHADTGTNANAIQRKYILQGITVIKA